MSDISQQVIEEEWVSFPGGELQGKRPKGLCPACRKRGTPAPTLCFQCYRVSACGPLEDREFSNAAARASGGGAPRALINADDWQSHLPFEPVNRPRLAALKADRVVASATLREGTGRFEEGRRQAQMAARRALQRIDAALEARQLDSAARQRVMATAVHAAELQLPESWLPFVVAG